MPHELAYLLCATPRSGTTLLCDLLSGTGAAGNPQSFYRRQDIEKRAGGWGLRPEDFQGKADFDRAYLSATRQEGAGQTGVFGLRLMWGTVSELAERLGFLQPYATDRALFERAFGPLIYIHVSRRDKVAQAISLLKAEQSGLWHAAADGSERQRTAPAAPVAYDPARIAELHDELQRDDAAWGAFFARHDIAPMRVEYEALAAAPRAEVRKILLALGRPPQLADDLAVQTSRMANVESSAWAERFRREQGADRT